MTLIKEQYEKLVKELESKDYHKIRKSYGGSSYSYRNEDYAFWKSFHVTYADLDNSDTKQIGYQLAVLVYDWRGYPNAYQGQDYGIQFEFLLGSNPFVDRFDFTISDSIATIKQFEELAEEVYQKIFKGFITEKFVKKGDS